MKKLPRYCIKHLVLLVRGNISFHEAFKYLLLFLRICRSIDSVLLDITHQKFPNEEPLCVSDFTKIYAFKFMNKKELSCTILICDAINAKLSSDEYDDVVRKAQDAIVSNLGELSHKWMLDVETLAMCGGLYVFANEIRKLSIGKLVGKYEQYKNVHIFSDVQRLFSVHLANGDFSRAMSTLQRGGKRWKRFNPYLHDIFTASNRNRVFDAIPRRGIQNTERKFSNLIKDKRVAVLGPSSGAFKSDEILNEFDVVIRINYRGADRLSDESRKCTTDISYYNTGASESISTYNDLTFFSDLKMTVFKKSTYRYQKDLVLDGKARHLISSTSPYMYQGFGTMIQEVLLDLFYFSPKRIKVFNINLFLARSAVERHQKGYYFEEYKQGMNEWMIWSYAIHNIISNYELTKLWFDLGCFEADEELTDVLALGKTEYLKRMEAIAYSKPQKIEDSDVDSFNNVDKNPFFRKLYNELCDLSN